LEQENANLPAGGDVNVRRTQVGAVKNKFLGVIQTYQKVEQESRSKYRSRMERQYKIGRLRFVVLEIRYFP
jgi:syntaxin 1B/2/3